METLSTLLLIRFGLVVGGIVIVALVVFAVAVVLRRRGRLDDVRERVEPFVRAAARTAASRYLGTPRIERPRADDPRKDTERRP